MRKPSVGPRRAMRSPQYASLLRRTASQSLLTNSWIPRVITRALYACRKRSRRVSAEGAAFCTEGLLDRGGNLVELVEPRVMPQAERLALHFEVPAIASGAEAQVSIDGHPASAGVTGGVDERRALHVQLKDQGLQRAADAKKRRDALFIEL